MSLSVLIVGAGRIGAFYDKPGQEQILSHAHAFSSHPDFELAGFVDPNLEAGERAAILWGGQAFPDLASAFAHRGSIDVVVVAVPDELHALTLDQLAESTVRLIFAEKPFTQSESQAQAVVDRLSQRGLPIVVNYSRRFVPQFAEMKQRISSEFGRLLRGTAYYGKGSLHNGSHLINLLLFLFGDIKVCRSLDRPLLDWSSADPTGSALLQTSDGGTIGVWAVDSQLLTIFELDLLFENARVRMTNSGQTLEIQIVVADPLFAGYRILGPSESFATELFQSLKYARQNILDILNGTASSLSPVEDALRTHRLCSELRG